MQAGRSWSMCGPFRHRQNALFALRLAEAVQRALQAHVLAAGQVWIERRLLQRGADRAPHLRALVHDVKAGHAGCARGGG